MYVFSIKLTLTLTREMDLVNSLHLFPYQPFLHDSTILAAQSSHRPIAHFGTRTSIPPIFLPTFALALVQYSSRLFPVLG